MDQLQRGTMEGRHGGKRFRKRTTERAKFRQQIVMRMIAFCRYLLYGSRLQRLGFTSFVYRSLFFWAYGNAGNLRVPYYDYVFSAPSRDITILPDLLNSCYERFELDLLIRLLKPGMTFVDVGANIGIFSVIGAGCVGSSGLV